MRRAVEDPAASPELRWLRRSLHACDLLASVQSISLSDRALVVFAIEWAPYGGADAEELFIRFGVQRNRFLLLLRAAMVPRASDLERLRILKTTLCNDLLRAWRASPFQHAGEGHDNATRGDPMVADQRP
ncbi:hypothetical protein COO55_41015 [Rhodococcus opacus]|jgi:hypothetical protein|nr:hypothetical protein COO55_41015 [Rhodococcus opacus]